MTTPAPSRHARQRATPRAAAANREAASAARAAKTARPAAPPLTTRQKFAKGATRRATILTPEGAGAATAGYAVGTARSAGRARLPTGDRQYQGVILAEFLAATLIVAVAPLAKGGDATAQAKGSPSPYSVNNLKQLLAIGAAYFVLALLSSGKHGRLAAWFGGLILIGIGLSETATGGLAAIFKVFAPGNFGQPPGTDQPGLIIPPGLVQETQQAGNLLPGGQVQPTPTGAATTNQQLTGGA